MLIRYIGTEKRVQYRTVFASSHGYFTHALKDYLRPEWHILGNVTGTAEYVDVERYKQIRIAKVSNI